MSGFSKRSEFIKGLGELKVKIGEEEKAYFDNDFLIQRFLGMSKQDIDANKEAMERKEKEKKKAEEKGGEGEKKEGEEEAPAVTL